MFDKGSDHTLQGLVQNQALGVGLSVRAYLWLSTPFAAELLQLHISERLGQWP